MADIPRGWATACLQELGRWGSGGTPSRRIPQYHGKGVPWVKSGDLPDGPVSRTEEEITELGLQNSAAKLLPVGTISVALYGATIGKLGVLTFPAATNQACANIVPDNALVDTKYLFFTLLAARSKLIEMGQGGAQPNISQEILRRFEINIPPLAEQRRIVAKLESLLAKVNACQERLDRIPGILKRFRQSVVAAACSGRLTEDWRAQKGHSESLSSTWREVEVGDVIESLKYGTAQKCTPEGRGVPVLRIPNIAEGKINHTELKYAALPSKECEQLRLKPGDILVIRSNGSVSHVGKCAVVSQKESGFAYAGYLIRIRPLPDRIAPLFLNLVLTSQDIRNQIELEARSTSGVHNINGDEIRALRFSLPLPSEQKEIVRRVNELFAFADKVEARYKEAKAQVDKLAQSILAKAFRGELVPQDPNDEPAEKLLERIRQEREGDSSIRKRVKPPRIPHVKTR